MKIKLLLISVLCLLSFSLCAATKPDSIMTYKEVDGHSLNLHIFTPQKHLASENKPAIVFFFGGGWIGGKPEQFYKQSQYLAKRGMVAISAEYRIKNTHGTSPKEALRDAKSAIRWVRAQSNDLGIDPNKIVAAGASAGGQLAAATATSIGFNEATDDVKISARPNALVLFNPVIDNGPSGYGFNRVEDYWQDFSPMHNISDNMPPTILFLGTKDKLIPVSTAKKFKAKVEEQSGRCELHLYPNQPHGFFNVKKYNETLQATDQFLVSLGFIKE